MTENPEIPEAKDPFEKRVAITIAIIAVCFSFISNRGERAKTEAIIQTNEATNSWGYYQAKSLKGHVSELEQNMLTLFEPQATDKAAIAARIAAIKEGQARYEIERAKVKHEAETLMAEAKTQTKKSEGFESAALILQVSIVLCSVAILSRWKPLWAIGILTCLCGIALGLAV